MRIFVLFGVLAIILMVLAGCRFYGHDASGKHIKSATQKDQQTLAQQTYYQDKRRPCAQPAVSGYKPYTGCGQAIAEQYAGSNRVIPYPNYVPPSIAATPVIATPYQSNVMVPYTQSYQPNYIK